MTHRSFRVYCGAVLAVAVSLLLPESSHAQQPDPSDAAGKALAKMKDALPGILSKRLTGTGRHHGIAKVDLVRRTGPAEAKISILIPLLDPIGRIKDEAHTASFYLQFYGQHWTITRWDSSLSGAADDMPLRLAIHGVMRDIDKVAAK